MNKLNNIKRLQVIAALVEGNFLRATARMCDVAFNTVLKLLPMIGAACLEHQDKALRNLTSKRIQCDEIWSFVGAKGKNTSAEKKAEGWGDIWTWVAIDPDTKLVPSFMVGSRGARTAKLFMDDLAGRLANRVQLTTDGHRVYLQAVEDSFGSEIDYAMLTLYVITFSQRVAKGSQPKSAPPRQPALAELQIETAKMATSTDMVTPYGQK